MNARRKFFIHVGFPKTATTTLQKRLFARHPDICYLGKPLTGNLLDIEYRMLNLDSIQFARALPELREMFLAIMQQCTDARNALLSHEGFLRTTRYSGHDIGRTAERIKQVFSDPVAAEFEVHVLITIRKQVDIIPSYFFDSVSHSPRRFRQFLENSLENPLYGYFPSLFYDEVVRYYCTMFGKDRVTVMPFEAFITRRDDFLKSLGGYLEIDQGTCLKLVSGGSYNTKTRSGSGYRLTANEYVLDLINRFQPQRNELPGLLRLFLKRIPMKNYVFAMSPADRDRVQALFAGANQRLSEEFDLKLEEFGYY
jgi:hypothetical protein